MAITLHETFAPTHELYGYQVRIDLTDGNRLYHEQGVWKTEPTPAQIEARVAELVAFTTRRLIDEARPPDPTDRDRLDGSERMVLRGILEVAATSEHVASLTISAANKLGIQARLAIIKNTLVDALTEMRKT